MDDGHDQLVGQKKAGRSTSKNRTDRLGNDKSINVVGANVRESLVY